VDFNTLLEIKIENGSLLVLLGPLLIVVILITLMFVIYGAWRNRSKIKLKWKPVEVEASIAKLGSVKLVPDNEMVRIAHNAWTELITRKAAIPFDEENDLIVEVYNSWFELFREFRILTKSIPAEEVRNNKDYKQLVQLLIDALNKGLRPNLTRWQAKFRHWYDEEQKKRPELSPQEIQRLFPQYNELVTDLKRVNTQLIGFAEALRKIAHG